MKDPELDFSSDTWKAIKARAVKQIDDLRVRNDSIGHGVMETARIRNTIAVWKSILALETNASSPENSADDSGFDTY